MRHTRTTIFILAAATISAVAGMSPGTLALQAVSAAQARELVKEGKGCTTPGDIFYSRGAFAMHKGQRYQCVEIFGENLKPAGSAWIIAEQ